jgi:hypothetical protein
MVPSGGALSLAARATIRKNPRKGSRRTPATALSIPKLMPSLPVSTILISVGRAASNNRIRVRPLLAELTHRLRQNVSGHKMFRAQGLRGGDDRTERGWRFPKGRTNGPLPTKRRDADNMR